MAVQLPTYPAAAGPNIARRIESHRPRYRDRAETLRQRLAAVDEEWARAFEREDVRAKARDRVNEMAKIATRIL